MRIKGFHISRYGPLPEFSVRDLPSFALFYGPNERGKTLLIDALLKLLFKRELKRRHVRSFGNLARVSEEPEGYVVIECRGDERKLETRETISSCSGVRITPADFRNVFLIRDGDLSIEEEKNYYTDVTEKLTGIRTSEVDKLMKLVAQKGRLTSPRPDSGLSDHSDYGKIASKVERAQSLIAELSALRARLAESHFDELEMSLVEARERLSKIGEALDLQERAAQRQRLEKAAGELAELKALSKSLSEMDAIRESDIHSWQEAEWSRERIEREILEKRQLLKKKVQQREVARLISQSRVRRREKLEALKGRIDSELQPKILELRQEQRALTEAEARGGFNRGAAAVSLGLLFLALARSIVSPSIFFWAITGVSFIGLLFFAWRLFVLSRIRGRAAAGFQALRLNGIDIGLKPVDSLDELLQRIRSFEGTMEEARRRAEEAGSKEQFLESEVERIHGEIRETDDALKKAQKSIHSYQLASGRDSIADFRKALQIKRDKERKRDSLVAVLKSTLGSPDSAEFEITEWEKAVAIPFERDDPAWSVQYDLEAAQALLEEKASLENRIAALEDARRDADDAFRFIASKAGDVGLSDELPEYRRTTAALEALEETLQAFIRKIESEKESALVAIRFLQEIRDEERARVGNLFGRGETVSRYFAEATGHLYSEVCYDTKTSQVYVLRSDGSRVDVNCLSGGAFDQLYLAIRLSIGERFFHHEQGFFIMDDPFVRSDFDRLKNQASTLARLAKAGWQILYFSAKKEILEALDKHIAGGDVRLIELTEPITVE